MQCIPGAANGTFDFQKEWNVPECNHTTEPENINLDSAILELTYLLTALNITTNDSDSVTHHQEIKKEVTHKEDCGFPYNVKQTCDKLETGEWNCTHEDYPVSELQQVRFNTTDTMFSLTRRNISQFRMMTFDNTTNRKNAMIGGWTFGHINKHGRSQADVAFINQGIQYVWDIFNSTSKLLKFDWQSVLDNATLVTNNDPFLPNDSSIINSFKVIFEYMDIQNATKVWFNNKNWASLPIQINLFYNAALRSNLLPGKSPSDFGILAISHPMNDTAEDILNSMAIQKSGTFRIVLMTLAICVIAASFSMFLVSENASKSKHLQQVFGISPFLYHLVNLIYDFVIYFVCVLLIILTYWLVGTALFTFSFEAFVSSIIIFVFYG
jgi:hypothetical protein